MPNKLENRPRGRKSHGSKSILFSFRCPDNLANKISNIAEKHNINSSAAIIHLIETHPKTK